MKHVVKFFDRLEDKIRSGLSRYPLTYAIIGAVGIVLFWRGVWHTADLFSFMTGPVTLIIGVAILLLTGLFVSFFVGDNIILTGLKHEKKLVEKTESEIHTEADELHELKQSMETIKRELSEIEKTLAKK